MAFNYFLVTSEKVHFKSCLFSISHIKEKLNLEFFLCSKILLNLTGQQLPALVFNSIYNQHEGHRDYA